MVSKAEVKNIKTSLRVCLFETHLIDQVKYNLFWKLLGVRMGTYSDSGLDDFVAVASLIHLLFQIAVSFGVDAIFLSSE